MGSRVPFPFSTNEGSGEGGHGQEPGIVEQVLPRNVDQLGRAAQAQRDAHACAATTSVGHGVSVEVANLLAEQGPEQPAAEVPRIVDHSRAGSARLVRM